jgi:hypothetical protein
MSRQHLMNIYVELTSKFNAGRLRALISSGQAVVLHGFAMMSKDGDWIIREDSECLDHILQVLEQYGAAYRFGAPLDSRWLGGAWSSHFEFVRGAMRVRTDFVSRPPRLKLDEVEALFPALSGHELPFVPLRELAELKKTNREKDYAVIGELARAMNDVDSQLLYSRSARDLLSLAEKFPERLRRARELRPALDQLAAGREALEAALDAERRVLMRTNEARLSAYLEASRQWSGLWPSVSREIEGKRLREAHSIVCSRAKGVLPFTV